MNFNRDKLLDHTIAGLLTAMLLLPGLVMPQQSDAEAPRMLTEAPLEIKALESQLAVLEGLANPDPREAAAIEFYRNAISQLLAQQRENKAAAGFKQSLDAAPARRAELTEELARLSASQPETAQSAEDVVITLAELERQLDQAQANRQVLQNRLDELQVRQASERLRPDQLIEELAEIKLQMEQVAGEIRSRKDEGSGVESAARRAALLASEQMLNSRLNRLEMERLSLGPRFELLNLEIGKLQRQIQHADRALQGLQQRLSERRSDEAAAAAMAAAEVNREALGKHPLIQREAARNQDLSTELSGLTRTLERTLKSRADVARQLQILGASLDRARHQLEIVGLDEDLGKLLREQREELPSLKRLQSNADDTRNQIAKVRLELFRLQDRRDRLAAGDLDGRLEAVQAGDLAAGETAALSVELEQLLADRAQLVEQLQSGYSRLERVLGDRELDQQQLIVKVEQYAELLDRHLIWMPSAPQLDHTAFAKVLQGVQVLVSPATWSKPLALLYTAVGNNLLLVAIVLLVVFALLVSRERMRLALNKVAPKVGNVRHDSFLYTLRAFNATLLLAAPWVIVAFVLAWLLKQGPDEIGDAFGQGFQRVALLLLLLQPLRYLLIDNGLAEVHFDWDRRNVRLLRRHLRWLLTAVLPLSFIVGLTEGQVEAFYRDYMGRIAAILGASLFGYFGWRVLDPRRGLFRRQQAAQETAGWSVHGLWRPLVLAMCLVLVVLDVKGYYYTELRLVHIYYSSAVVGFTVLVLYHLAERWLLVAERRLAFSRALARRQAVQDSRAAKEAAEAAGETVQEPPEHEEITLDTINEQTRSLLALGAVVLAVIGLFPVWSELLPAFGRLDEIVLWQYTQNVAGAPQQIPVSIWDLLLALLVVVLTLVAGNNLPGLLEIAILQPMALDSGSRYAVAKVSRYSIYTAGILVTIGILGVAWGDVQWLIAAMGVGLGFGLQEIFANFISGLMILFERPIRIGDTVTVGDISGTVSRIRIRATTITDFDNKELLVPNKAFVTDPLINWTLSDPITRVKFRVGIAYGSDTELAHRIMMGVLRAHPDVLDEPKPTVFFVGFGDSSLDFEMRAFCPDRLKRMPLLHDLHMALDRELKRAGIEIPFPQRDLHLRSAAPGIEFGQQAGRPENPDKGPHKQP